MWCPRKSTGSPLAKRTHGIRPDKQRVQRWACLAISGISLRASSHPYRRAGEGWPRGNDVVIAIRIERNDPGDLVRAQWPPETAPRLQA
jgi:hypothetical protein